jgi:molecular chaperone DnaK
MADLVGIDLGTTYSAIAVIDEHGKAVIVPNAEGERTTPSVVYFDESGEIVVGKIAKQSGSADPKNFVDMVKRHIGEEGWTREFHGHAYTPESISALVLRKLVNDASAHLGEAITQAVITVPAYFTDVERKATEDAGKIAGLNVLAIFNEPTAAALAYGFHRREEEQTVLVYDLGGGTFDVSVVRIREDDLDILATDGERRLGGRDWDEELVNEIARDG